MKKFLIASLSFLFNLVACTDYQAEYEDKYEALVSEPIEVLDSSAKETIIDTRDNQVYEVVQIGTQKWLARNLNYNDGKGKCPSDDKSLCKMYGRLYNANSIIKVHKSDKANGDQEIYDSLRALCPEGWHVPFKSEWKILKDYVAKQGHKGEVGKALKSVDGWFAADSMVELSKDDIRFAVASGNDPYGFKALPAGICRDSECSSFDNAYFWGVADTVRESFAMMLVGYAISFENDDFVRDGNINYLNNPRVSVRCIEGARQEAYFDSSSMKKVNDVSKEEISSSSEESSEENTEKSSDSAVKSSSSVVPSSASVANSSSSVTKSSSSVASSSTSVIRSSSSIVKSKYDCSLYNCVTTEYLNQDMLAAGLYGEYLDTRDNQVYRTIEIGTQTWFAQNLNYESIKSECYEGSAANCKKYGRLYLQSEATEVCPTGWHLPSEAEWEVLNAYVDEINGADAVGTSLKALGVWDDISSVPAGKDLVGFSGLPSVYFGAVVTCGGVKTHGLYWTADKNEYRCLLSDNSILYDNIDSYAYTYGMSVRCLKGTAQTTTKSSSSSAVAPKSSSSVSNAAKGRLFVDLGDKVYSANTSGSPVTVNLVGMPDTSSLDYIAIYFEPNMSGSYARNLAVIADSSTLYYMRQHMYASNRASVITTGDKNFTFTAVEDLDTKSIDGGLNYYWSGWSSGQGHVKLVYDRSKLTFYLYVEETYIGYGSVSMDPIAIDAIKIGREQPYGTNTCQVSNVRVAGFSTLEAAKAWDGVAF